MRPFAGQAQAGDGCTGFAAGVRELAAGAPEVDLEEELGPDEPVGGVSLSCCPG